MKGNHMIVDRDAIVFEKLRFRNVFHLHEDEKSVFSNFYGLKSVYEKLRFQNVFRPHAKPAFFQISPV